jgi:hypothetical protein
LVREQISSIEKTRTELERAPDTRPHAMVRLLSRVIGIGIETADMLVRDLGLLDNSYRVTVTLENVRHRLPSGTIGEGAVDQNDSLDGRVRRG